LNPPLKSLLYEQITELNEFSTSDFLPKNVIDNKNVEYKAANKASIKDLNEKLLLRFLHSIISRVINKTNRRNKQIKTD
jgi:hypothetical protein